MKTSWLRGMLLGVSLALLLAGGIALAQGLSVTVDQDCFECAPGGEEPDAEHTVVLTLDDYTEADLCGEIRIDGEVFVTSGDCSIPPHECPCEVWLAVDCPEMMLHTKNECMPDAVAPSVQNGPVAEYGAWVVKAWQESNGEPLGPARFVGFTFAEDCAAQEEVTAFLPEPGTIALLGSGLAGLAGYAALRWRTRS